MQRAVEFLSGEQIAVGQRNSLRKVFKKMIFLRQRQVCFGYRTDGAHVHDIQEIHKHHKISDSYS